MFGFLYALFMTGVGVKETVSNNIDQENAFQKALKENKDIFYDNHGNMFFIERTYLKDGNVFYKPIKCSYLTKKDYMGLWHKIIVPIKHSNIVLKDCTQEAIDEFYNKRKLIREKSHRNNDEYYFVPIDDDVLKFVRFIGRKNFDRFFLRHCGWFESATDKRYCLERICDHKHSFKYYKIYYEDLYRNGIFYGQCLDFNSQQIITKEEYIKMGGNEKGGHIFTIWR